MATVWTVIGLMAVAAMLYAELRAIHTLALARNTEAMGLGILFAGGLACALSFLLLRLRRLYAFSPGGSPEQIGVRRARFSVAASILIAVLLLAAFWPSSADRDQAGPGRRDTMYDHWREIPPTSPFGPVVPGGAFRN